MEFLVGAQVVGKNTAGNGIVEQVADGSKFAAVFQAAQVGDFPSAENLDPLIGKILIKTHYRPHRAVKVRDADFPRQTLPAAYAVEIK